MSAEKRGRGPTPPRTTAAGFDAVRAAILETVARIPRGKEASYTQVAFAAGWPGRARLVGRVLSDLLGSERLQWHRVINAQGKIALPIDHPSHAEQRRRLEAEGLVFLNGRVNFKTQGWQPGESSPLLD